MARSRSHSRELSKERRSNSPSDTNSKALDNGNTEGKRIHVANLSEDINKQDLLNSFEPFGAISDVWVASYSPYFAFLVFEKKSSAEEAIRKMSNSYLNGCRIRTSMALPRRGNGDRPQRFNRDGGDFRKRFDDRRDNYRDDRSRGDDRRNSYRNDDRDRRTDRRDDRRRDDGRSDKRDSYRGRDERKSGRDRSRSRSPVARRRSRS